MAIFKCKMCGGTLEIVENATTATCEYCASQQTLPRISDDKIAKLHERAGRFRRNSEFDKAMGVYEQILDENPEDAESYWSLVLCRYGIEYVEDPATKRRIPTVNRTQFTSIFDDDNYKSAISHADLSQKAIYEYEAKTINEIQKEILDISQREEPFDVFICYKESDENGQRTRDSVYANDLYYQLTQEGFKVFYARITLEGILGEKYEPHIFAALNSAKIMVVIGTKPEYFNAAWVKNEWSRYLSLIKNGAKKVLIPAYSGMDPYDMPPEFAHLQAQDMTKLGFMPDLVRGIKKIIGVTEPPRAAAAPVGAVSNRSDIEALLKRVTIFLDNQDWSNADAYCEKVLDIDPENAKANLYKLYAQLHVSSDNNLENYRSELDRFSAYKNAVRYADERTVKRLSECNRIIKERLAKEEAERIERERQETAARLERERLQQERNEREAQKRREIASLTAAKDNAAKLLNSYVNKKAQLESAIGWKEKEIQDFDNLKKKRTNTAVPVIVLWVACAFFLILSSIPFMNIMLAITAILFVIFAIRLAKFQHKSWGVVILNVLYGIYSLVQAFKTLKSGRGVNIQGLQNELKQLNTQVQQLDAQIDGARHSLSEVNRKLQEKRQES